METHEEYLLRIFEENKRNMPRGRGRPGKSLSERSHAVTFYMALKDADMLADLGGGNRSAGLSKVLAFYRNSQAGALAAIKAAAERRDQDAVKATGGFDD